MQCPIFVLVVQSLLVSAMSKRAAPPPEDGVLVKKARPSTPPSNQIVISSSNDERNKGLVRSVKRTSNLDAPIVSLAGAHSVSVTSARKHIRVVLKQVM
jgi:Prp8 binding protein